jgi:hypothetical protein
LGVRLGGLALGSGRGRIAGGHADLLLYLRGHCIHGQPLTRLATFYQYGVVKAVVKKMLSKGKGATQTE